VKTAVCVEVEFAPGLKAEAGLFHPCRVALNILRGRITEKTSWFLLELRGTAARIDSAIRAFRDRGVTVRLPA
jgi:hypothetical protein